MKLTKRRHGAALVAQGLKIHLPKERTQARALVWAGPTCSGRLSREPHLVKPTCLEPQLRNERSHSSEEPERGGWRGAPLPVTRESLCAAAETQHSRRQTNKSVRKTKRGCYTSFNCKHRRRIILRGRFANQI